MTLKQARSSFRVKMAKYKFPCSFFIEKYCKWINNLNDQGSIFYPRILSLMAPTLPYFMVMEDLIIIHSPLMDRHQVPWASFSSIVSMEFTLKPILEVEGKFYAIIRQMNSLTMITSFCNKSSENTVRVGTSRV